MGLELRMGWYRNLCLELYPTFDVASRSISSCCHQNRLFNLIFRSYDVDVFLIEWFFLLSQVVVHAVSAHRLLHDPQRHKTNPVGIHRVDGDHFPECSGAWGEWHVWLDVFRAGWKVLVAEFGWFSSKLLTYHFLVSDPSCGDWDCPQQFDHHDSASILASDGRVRCHSCYSNRPSVTWHSVSTSGVEHHGNYSLRILRFQSARCRAAFPRFLKVSKRKFTTDKSAGLKWFFVRDYFMPG